MNSSAHLRLDLKKNNFHYFSQKSIKLPIPAIVKMSNIEIGITSFVYKISTESLNACIVGFSRSANSNTLSKISREPRELPWQRKFGQK